MDINSIVELYNTRQLDAQAALELLNKNNLLAEAFMCLLSRCQEDQAAYESLCPKYEPSAPSRYLNT